MTYELARVMFMLAGSIKAGWMLACVAAYFS